jgi:hypothetical protein
MLHFCNKFTCKKGITVSSAEYTKLKIAHQNGILNMGVIAWVNMKDIKRNFCKN